MSGIMLVMSFLVMAWYEEWAFSLRMLDTGAAMAKLGMNR
jgi:hypothetical protein